MYDVNPLGPIMHLKEIEREALALRIATAKGRSGSLNAASAWVMGSLKRLLTSPSGEVSAGHSANVARQ